MKTETKTVYTCEFCNKKYFRKHAAEQHEVGCTRNPENFRHCFQCEFLTKKKVEVDNIYYNSYNSETIDVEILFCAKKEIPMQTPKNEYKGNGHRIEDEEVSPMPKECVEFKDKRDLTWLNLDQQ